MPCGQRILELSIPSIYEPGLHAGGEIGVQLQQSIVAADDVVFQQLDDEAVLLNLASGAYFGLNVVGTRMWQLIGEHRSLERVLDTLVQEYEVEREVLERDLLALTEQLRTKGLVRIAS